MVINVLIDQAQVERVVLKENSHEALNFLSQPNNMASRVYDEKGIEYRKKGAQELTDSSAIGKRARLGVNIEEEMRYEILKTVFFFDCYI